MEDVLHTLAGEVHGTRAVQKFGIPECALDTISVDDISKYSVEGLIEEGSSTLDESRKLAHPEKTLQLRRAFVGGALRRC